MKRLLIIALGGLSMPINCMLTIQHAMTHTIDAESLTEWREGTQQMADNLQQTGSNLIKIDKSLDKLIAFVSPQELAKIITHIGISTAAIASLFTALYIIYNAADTELKRKQPIENSFTNNHLVGGCGVALLFTSFYALTHSYALAQRTLL